MSKINISLDTETWGKRAGCDARSIGAVLFNPYQRRDTINNLVGSSGLADDATSFYVAVDNPLTPYSARDGGDGFGEQTLAKLHGDHRKYKGLFRDSETVDWWFSQPTEAQAAFANPIDLKEGLQQLSDWLANAGVDPNKDNSCIWCHGAAYDLPIVEAWYHAVGLPVPWFYRAPRDTRTAFDMAAVGNHSKWLQQFQQGIKHHARDDSKTQALGIIGAHQRLSF